MLPTISGGFPRLLFHITFLVILSLSFLEHVPRFKDRSPILNKAVVFLHFIYFSIVCGTILLVHLQLRNKGKYC